MKHTIEPFYNTDSEILILGSFPSVTSRNYGFYYSHPQNRFWKVLSSIYKEKIEDDIESKKAFLTKHKIALYDVVFSCTITNSSDATIKDVTPTNLDIILANSNIKHIFLNGKKAYNIYIKYFKNVKVPFTYLPSTSPLNASYNLEQLIKEFQKILLVF